MRVLVVDDNVSDAEQIASIIRDARHHVAVVNGGAKALDEIHQGAWDLAVTDIYMPDVDGLDVLREVRRLSKPFPVIAVSCPRSFSPGFNPLKCAEALGARATIEKPVRPALLLQTIRNLSRMESHGRVE